MRSSYRFARTPSVEIYMKFCTGAKKLVWLVTNSHHRQPKKILHFLFCMFNSFVKARWNLGVWGPLFHRNFYIMRPIAAIQQFFFLFRLTWRERKRVEKKMIIYTFACYSQEDVSWKSCNLKTTLCVCNVILIFVNSSWSIIDARNHTDWKVITKTKEYKLTK